VRPPNKRDLGRTKLRLEIVGVPRHLRVRVIVGVRVADHEGKVASKRIRRVVRAFGDLLADLLQRDRLRDDKVVVRVLLLVGQFRKEAAR
jgi:hypothetical protein